MFQRTTVLGDNRPALRAGDSKIGTPNTRHAAAQLYQTTKAAQLNAITMARDLLDEIVSSVLNGPSRPFRITQRQTGHPLTQQPIDHRILHRIKKGDSGKDEPGLRFDVIQIDYATYVDRLGTTAETQHISGDDFGDEDKTLGSLYGDIDAPKKTTEPSGERCMISRRCWRGSPPYRNRRHGAFLLV